MARANAFFERPAGRVMHYIARRAHSYPTISAVAQLRPIFFQNRNIEKSLIIDILEDKLWESMGSLLN
jgi:hypothetical protein